MHVAGADPAGRSTNGGESRELAEAVHQLTGVRASIGPVVKTIRFGVTTHRVTLEARSATWLEGEPTPGPGLVDATWEPLEAFKRYTLSSATRKLVAWMQSE